MNILHPKKRAEWDGPRRDELAKLLATIYAETADPKDKYARYYYKRMIKRISESLGMTLVDADSAAYRLCDYIDQHFEQYGQDGCECWKQDAKHDCVKCIEIRRSAL